MKYKPVFLLSVLFILISASFAFATQSQWEILGFQDPITMMTYGTLIAGIALLAGILFIFSVGEAADPSLLG